MNDTGIETNAFLGYPDTLSVRAGERIRFHLSSHLPEVDASFVRLRCADADATGPGLKYQELVSPLDGVHACGRGCPAAPACRCPQTAGWRRPGRFPSAAISGRRGSAPRRRPCSRAGMAKPAAATHFRPRGLA